MRNKTSPQKANNKSEVTLLQCNTQIFENFIKEMQAARKQREKEIEQINSYFLNMLIMISIWVWLGFTSM
jgi:hypothetical protein